MKELTLDNLVPVLIESLAWEERIMSTSLHGKRIELVIPRDELTNIPSHDNEQRLFRSFLSKFYLFSHNCICFRIFLGVL